MSDCVDARIDANVISTLKTIAPPSYETNIGTVERARSRLSINGRYPFTLVVQMEPEEVEEWALLKSDNLNYLIWHVDGVNDQSETANTEFSYRLRNVPADIAKALRADPSRGGLAENTRIVRSGFGFLLDVGVAEPGTYVLVEIQRSVNPDNPYELAP